MSFIGAALGLGSTATNAQQGGSGLNYNATGANVLNPATLQQANQTQAQANSGLDQQQSFLNALQGQNGIANQSANYAALQGVANGTGPNPAQAQLAQSTGQNVAQQGALMASQRGATANPALLARQAAQQGAATQQASVGQAATLQAQQSLNALNAQSGIAQNQVTNQANATTGFNQAAQSEQQNILGAISSQNNANVSNVASQNGANAGLAQVAAKGQQDVAGGVLGSVGQTLTALAANGGMIKQKFADGGLSVAPNLGSVAPADADSFSKQFLYGSSPSNKSTAAPTPTTSSDAASNQPALTQGTEDLSKGLVAAGKSIFGGGDAPSMGGNSADNLSMPEVGSQFAGSAPTLDFSNNSSAPHLAKGGKVPALVSPGERYLAPREVSEVAKGKKSPMKAGEKIPGKPKVAGAKNSYENDTVPKTLEEGGIVIPRSITQGKNAEKKAHAFVSAILAKQSMKAKH